MIVTTGQPYQQVDHIVRTEVAQVFVVARVVVLVLAAIGKSCWVGRGQGDILVEGFVDFVFWAVAVVVVVWLDPKDGDHLRQEMDPIKRQREIIMLSLLHEY